MKKTAIAILSFDILLLIAWTANAAYLAFNLKLECFHSQAIVHFLILFHFVLAIHMANLVGEITREQFHASEAKKKLTLLPFYIYSPLAWILISLLSLVGDVVLLTWAIIEYRGIEADECNVARITHITLDSVALVISVVSIVWFVVFASATIRGERRKSVNYV